MKRKKFYKIMVSVLLIGIFLFNAFPVLALQENTTSKEENVYVNMSAKGDIQSVYVVNIFTLEQDGKIVDYGDYTDIRNLSSSEEIQKEANQVSLNGKAGKNYYQGTLNVKEIPWKIEVSYYLDGNQIDEQQLAGKAGRLSIKIKVSKNPNVQATFFDNYLLQATLSLDSQTCKNIEAQGATIANVGSKKQITYNFLAGTEKEIEITAEVTDFELVDGISFNGLLMKMAIDNLDTSVLTNKVSQLKTGVSTLNTGMNKLKTGSSKYKVALGELASKTKDLPSQSKQVASGIQSSLNGVKQIESQLKNATTNGNTADLQTQITKQIDGSLQKDSHYQALKQANPEMAAYMRQTLISTSLTTAKTVASTYEQQVSSSMTELNSGLKQLESGLSTLSSAYSKMDEGIAKVASGIQTLNNSYTDIQEGITSATKGSNTLYDKTKNLDSQVDDEIEEMLASFENKDYQAVSFVDEQNASISNVQFIIKTTGIQKEEQEPLEEQTKEETSFWEKLVALFKK